MLTRYLHPLGVAGCFFIAGCCAVTATLTTVAAEPSSFDLKLRFERESVDGSDHYESMVRGETWVASQTAIIVCDMWDSHHCYNAVQREKEFAPRLNSVVSQVRHWGGIVIHSPSGCMDAYANHPARKRAMSVPASPSYPDQIESWCYKIASEENVEYPIDQSDGGEDDTPEEKANWERQLRFEGRDVKQPWKKQIDMIQVDANHDYISDSGKEIWNIIQNHGATNVILSGVHTNMCVLGRPFGLRRMASAGINVVLIRDLTDTMYNPLAKPYVSHFEGTDLIIRYIERHICPTITSDQLIGGSPFRFAGDLRSQ